MHGEPCVLECTGWKALDGFGELGVGVAAGAQSAQCDAGLGRNTGKESEVILPGAVHG